MKTEIKGITSLNNIKNNNLNYLKIQKNKKK